MGAFEAILVLTLIGFLMLAAEVFVPGLILGLMGGICLLAAVGVSFTAYGMMAGTLTLIGVLLVTGGGFVVWMFAFPHTPIGRRIMLRATDSMREAGKDPDRKELLGQVGSALTALRPAGTAVIEGRKVDVVSEFDFIPAGDPIIVVKEDGMRILVRKKV